MWGSGRVTKGNVPGWEVIVLSKRMRFMVRVKSSCSSLERASEQLSRLDQVGRGIERGGTRGEGEVRGRRRKEGKEEGGRQRKGERREVRGEKGFKFKFQLFKYNFQTLNFTGQCHCVVGYVLCPLHPSLPSLPSIPSIPLLHPSPPISFTWTLPCFLQSWRGSSNGRHSLQLLLPQLPHPLHRHTVHIEVVPQQGFRLLPVKYTT